MVIVTLQTYIVFKIRSCINLNLLMNTNSYVFSLHSGFLLAVTMDILDKWIFLRDAILAGQNSQKCPFASNYDISKIMNQKDIIYSLSNKPRTLPCSAEEMDNLRNAVKEGAESGGCTYSTWHQRMDEALEMADEHINTFRYYESLRNNSKFTATLSIDQIDHLEQEMRYELKMHLPYMDSYHMAAITADNIVKRANACSPPSINCVRESEVNPVHSDSCNGVSEMQLPGKVCDPFLF